jgi:hypothetical protein
VFTPVRAVNPDGIVAASALVHLDRPRLRGLHRPPNPARSPGGTSASSQASAAGIRQFIERVHFVRRVVLELPAVVLVLDAVGVGAAVTLELRLDPIGGGAIAIGALAAITELRQSFDGRLVFLQVEPCDHGLDRIGR